MTIYKYRGILKNPPELNEFYGISGFFSSDGGILSTLFYKKPFPFCC